MSTAYEPQVRDVVKVGGRHGHWMSVRRVFPIGQVVVAVDTLAQRHIVDWHDLTPVRSEDAARTPQQGEEA